MGLKDVDSMSVELERLKRELHLSQSHCAKLRAETLTWQGKACAAEERANELQSSCALALDDASIQAVKLSQQLAELTVRLQEQQCEASKFRKQHEDEIELLIASNRQREQILLDRETQLETEVRQLRRKQLQSALLRDGQHSPSLPGRIGVNSSGDEGEGPAPDRVIQHLHLATRKAQEAQSQRVQEAQAAAQLGQTQSQLAELQRRAECDARHLASIEAELGQSRARVEELGALESQLRQKAEALDKELQKERVLTRVAKQAAEEEAELRIRAERQCEELVAAIQKDLPEGARSILPARGDFRAVQAKEFSALRHYLKAARAAAGIADEGAEVDKSMASLRPSNGSSRAGRGAQGPPRFDEENKQALAGPGAAAMLATGKLPFAPRHPSGAPQGDLSPGENTSPSSSLSTKEEVDDDLYGPAEVDQSRSLRQEELEGVGDGDEGLEGVHEGGSPEAYEHTTTGNSASQAKSRTKTDATSTRKDKDEGDSEGATSADSDGESEGSDVSFSLPIPIKGAWRVAREVVAEYYDAGGPDEEDELEAVEGEVEELQDENDRLVEELNKVQAQVLKARKLVVNYEKMRRRIMQLRVCLELTRKVVEVKDKAVELAIGRARQAEARASDLERANLDMEDQLLEAEDELRKERGELDALKKYMARDGKVVDKRLQHLGAKKTMSSMSSMTSDTEGYTSIEEGANHKLGRPGNRKGAGTPKSRHMESDVESGAGTPTIQRVDSHGRPRSADVRRSGSGSGPGSAAGSGELKEKQHAMFDKRAATHLSRLDSMAVDRDPVGMKELQATRDSLKRSMREIREKAAVAVEMQLTQSEQSKSKTVRKSAEEESKKILNLVDEEVAESQCYIDKTERLLHKMAGLEVRGASAKKRLDNRREKLTELEMKLGLNAGKKKAANPSCFIPFQIPKTQDG